MRRLGTVFILALCVSAYSPAQAPPAGTRSDAAGRLAGTSSQPVGLSSDPFPRAPSQIRREALWTATPDHHQPFRNIGRQ